MSHFEKYSFNCSLLHTVWLIKWRDEWERKKNITKSLQFIECGKNQECGIASRWKTSKMYKKVCVHWKKAKYGFCFLSSLHCCCTERLFSARVRITSTRTMEMNSFFFIFILFRCLKYFFFAIATELEDYFVCAILAYTSLYT